MRMPSPPTEPAHLLSLHRTDARLRSRRAAHDHGFGLLRRLDYGSAGAKIRRDAVAAVNAADCVLILYTTLYRDGGAEFERAARTLEKAKREEFPELLVISRAAE